MTRDLKIYRLAYWVACLVLAGTFLVSGYFKISNPEAFAVAVSEYELLPDVFVEISAFVIQWLEIVCGITLLAIPRYRGPAIYLALVLLSIFSAAIAFNLLRGMQVNCGCFGNYAEPASGMHIIRNLLLMSLAGLAFYGKKKSAV